MLIVCRRFAGVQVSQADPAARVHADERGTEEQLAMFVGFLARGLSDVLTCYVLN
jgi:hypothetical protein